MNLVPGNKLGSYQILAAIGAGGMGEVYRAHDTKLDRDVALKILPQSFAADPDRLMRFEREAKTLASLNHPNIAAIYGIEESGGTRALVMELVEGEDLSVRLTRGPIPLDEALPIARQVAEALEAAHEAGIIHRDLKPANIKVRADGTVKVLDFGLAKALDPMASSSPDAANSPTMTSPAMTELGMILGTAGYMAPEQAKGKPVDKRADIWAFGVVLYEMLAGHSLYRGETVTETIAHVIMQPPSWDSLPESVSAPVRRLLRRCLEKDPRNRLQSAGDARLEIDEILSGSELEAGVPTTTGVARAASTPAWRRALPWAIAGVLLVALGYQLWPRPTASTRPARLVVQLTPGEDLPVLANSDGTIAVLSPDGETLVYLASSGTSRQLYVRRLDQLEATPLAGTEDGVQQFFSPDGASVAFFANGQLLRTALAGGVPTLIAPAPTARGGSWGPDDTIVFTANIQEGLSRVSAAGGTPVPVTTLGPNERTHRWPSILPDGKHVLFICQTAEGAYDDGTIEVARIDTGERKVLFRGGTFPRYVGGYLFYSRGSTLYAVRFDTDALELEGEPQPVLSGVLSSGGALGNSPGGAGAAQISIADNGTVAYLTGTALTLVTPLRLAIIERSGQILYEYPEPNSYRDPKFSPDGKQVAVRIGNEGAQLFVLDPQRGTLNQITFDGTTSISPAWSRQGRGIAFSSDRAAGEWAVYLIPIDGTGEAKPLTKTGFAGTPSSFSPDDQLLAATSRHPQGRADIEVVSTADGTVTPFLNSPNPELDGQFSPDGKWMTYVMVNPTGMGDVYVRAYPGGGALRKVSNGGGNQARWSKNGREIVYRDFEGQLTAVDVNLDGDGLALGIPHKLFDLVVAPGSSNAGSFDPAPDGNRFVVLLEDTQQTSPPKRTHVTMVFNFLEELQRATAGAAR